MKAERTCVTCAQVRFPDAMPSDERRPLVVQVPLQNSDAFMGESKKNLVILSTVRYALAIPVAILDQGLHAVRLVLIRGLDHFMQGFVAQASGLLSS